jgi:hypothetical protein
MAITEDFATELSRLPSSFVVGGGGKRCAAAVILPTQETSRANSTWHT